MALRFFIRWAADRQSQEPQCGLIPKCSLSDSHELMHLRQPLCSLCFLVSLALSQFLHLSSSLKQSAVHTKSKHGVTQERCFVLFHSAWKQVAVTSTQPVQDCPKLVQLFAAQVCGRQIPSSTNKEEGRCYITVTPAQHNISNCVFGTEKAAPAGAPFGDLLPKLDRPNRLPWRLGHLCHLPSWHIDNKFNSTHRDALPADSLLLEAQLNPVLRRKLGYLSAFLHHLGKLACRRAARQSLAGFCFETPSSVLLPTVPPSTAREPRESAPARCDAFLVLWHVYDLLKNGNRGETCTCGSGKTCTTGASTTSSITSSRVPFASFLEVASTPSCTINWSAEQEHSATTASVPSRRRASNMAHQATRRPAARNPIQHTGERESMTLLGVFPMNRSGQ